MSNVLPLSRERPPTSAPHQATARAPLVGRSGLSGATAIELFMSGPLDLAHFRMTLERLIDPSLKHFDTFTGRNLLPQLANEPLMRFDETQETVGVLLIVADADPEIERCVLDRYNPTPIFRKGFADVLASFLQGCREIFSQSLSEAARVDFLRLALVGRKGSRPEFHVGQHDGP